jgi:hypothetical protein
MSYREIRVLVRDDGLTALRLSDEKRAHAATLVGGDQVVEQAIAEAVAAGMTVHLLEGDRRATPAMLAAARGGAVHGHEDCMEMAQSGAMVKRDDEWRAMSSPAYAKADRPHVPPLVVVLGAAGTFREAPKQWEDTLWACRNNGVAALVVVDSTRSSAFSSYRVWELCRAGGVADFARTLVSA